MFCACNCVPRPGPQTTPAVFSFCSYLVPKGSIPPPAQYSFVLHFCRCGPLLKIKASRGETRIRSTHYETPDPQIPPNTTPLHTLPSCYAKVRIFHRIVPRRRLMPDSNQMVSTRRNSRRQFRGQFGGEFFLSHSPLRTKT